MSPGQLCNITNYLCFTTEVGQKRCYPVKNTLPPPSPTQYDVENQVKLQVLVFNIVSEVGAKIASGVCTKVPKVQTKLSQDFCP